MARTTLRLLVDWDGDELFANANAEITGKVWHLRCRHGRDGGSTLKNRSTGGTLSATLYNPDGLFSSFNTASPISGLIQPRRKVQLQLGRYALEFDGASGDVDFASPAELDDIFVGGGSVEAWVNAASDGEGSNAKIFDKTNWTLTTTLESGGAVKLSFFHGFSGTDGLWTTTNRPIVVGQWHHVAVTYNRDAVGNDPIIYVDGVAVAITELTTPSGTATSDNGASLVAGNNAADTRTFDGKLDELRVWNVIRSASEIADNRFIQLAGTEAGLAGYWRVDEGMGATLTDRTANANDGTIAGATWVKWLSEDVYAQVPVWTGWLITVVPENPIKALPRAQLSAHGSLALLNADDARVAPKSSILTGTAFGQVLDSAGWPATMRDIDAGQTTMTRWPGADSKALFALRKLDDTEIGFTRENRAGDVVWEDRHRRLGAPHLTSQQTYTDGAVTIRYQNIDQEDPFQYVYKVFRGSVTEYTVGSTQVLWSLAGALAIEAGQTVEIWAEFPRKDSPVEAIAADNWVSLVANTDYEFNSQSNGLGTDLTGNMAITESEFATAMKLSITNNAAVTAHKITLQARGEPLNQDATVSITAEQPGSPVETEWPSPAEFIPDLAEGEGHVKALRAVHGTVSPILTISYLANASVAFLEDVRDREVSDRVRVTSARLGIDEDHFIESKSLEIDRRGRITVGLELSSVRNVAPFWVLGIGLLAQSTVLNFK